MEFFCELWIRWDINIPSEIFRNISKKKKKENIDRSIRLLYRTLSVSRRMNNTENGGLFADYRPRRGRKRERGKGNYRSACYHSPVIISLRKILCIRLICFCWNPILLKRYCNDKLNKRFKDYLSLQPSVCFIYCYCCFFFVKWVDLVSWTISSVLMTIYRQQISGHRSPSPRLFSRKRRERGRKGRRFLHGRARRNKLPDNQQSQIVS